MTFGQTGYRFLYLELLEESAALWMKAVVGVAVYREQPYIGHFSCNDPLLCRVYDTAAYTVHLCMQRLIWDGIKCDRLVWVGDLYPECRTILSVFGDTSLLEESLDFVRSETPLPQWMNGLPSYSFWWLLNVWELYRYSGNQQYLIAQRDYVTALLRQMCGCVDAGGHLQLPRYFFDWPTDGTRAAAEGNRALFCWGLSVGEQIGACYSDAALAELCRLTRMRLATHPGEAVGYKQTAALLLLQGIPDPSGKLRKTLLEGGAAGWSTFMSYFLLQQTACCGGMSVALQTLREYYGGMLSMGATTFWEDFDIAWLPGAVPLEQWPLMGRSIHGAFGKYCYRGLRHSLCHGWSSGPVPFLVQSVLGIHFVQPGGNRLRLAPDLGDLQWAEGACPTSQGTVTVTCEKGTNGQIQATVTAPASVTVEAAAGIALIRR